MKTDIVYFTFDTYSIASDIIHQATGVAPVVAAGVGVAVFIGAIWVGAKIFYALKSMEGRRLARPEVE